MPDEKNLRWEETVRAAKYAEGFWKDRGREVLARAMANGLPFYALEDVPSIGITFVQVRYQKGERVRMKWATDKGLKKKQVLLGLCQWTLLPIGIRPIRPSLEPRNHQYSYLIHMKSEIVGKSADLYHFRVETKQDGTIIKSQVIDMGKVQGKDLRDHVPDGFRYPKQLVSRLNRCLSKYFFADLWCGPNYPAWYRPDDSYASYMGISEIPKEDKPDALKSLLQSPYGEAAAVLLSYSCFSLLKPWFTQYPSLDKKSTYLKVKRDLPKLFAINVQSRDLQSAEQMAEYCCGEFQHMGEGRLPIRDGVDIQKSPEKLTSLGENEFERKVLQSANILWVNRKPVGSLTKRKKVLDLHIPPGFDMVAYDFRPLDMMAAVVKGASYEDLRRQQRILVEDRNAQKSIAVEVLRDLNIISERYYFEFQNVDIQKEKQKILKDRLGVSLVEWLSELRHSLTEEIRWEAECEKDAFLEETQQLLSARLREMKRVHKNNCAQQNFLTPYYEKGLQELKESLKAVEIEQGVIEKITYLWASAKFFITTLPEVERSWISQQIFRNLCAFTEQQVNSWRACSYLEKYIIDALREKRSARLRGKWSDRAEIQVWYDPRNEEFLLPAQRYFAELQRYFAEPRVVTQRIFEKKLTEEGAIKTVERQNQLRRTFEVRVWKNGPKIAMLRVLPTAFSTAFWQRKDINMLLEPLRQDHTPMRG